MSRECMGATASSRARQPDGREKEVWIKQGKHDIWRHHIRLVHQEASINLNALYYLLIIWARYWKFMFIFCNKSFFRSRYFHILFFCEKGAQHSQCSKHGQLGLQSGDGGGWRYTLGLVRLVPWKELVWLKKEPSSLFFWLKWFWKGSFWNQFSLNQLGSIWSQSEYIMTFVVKDPNFYSRICKWG